MSSGDWLAVAAVVLVLAAVLGIDAVVRARYGDRDASEARVRRELRRHPPVDLDESTVVIVVNEGDRDVDK